MALSEEYCRKLITRVNELAYGDRAALAREMGLSERTLKNHIEIAKTKYQLTVVKAKSEPKRPQKREPEFDHAAYMRQRRKEKRVEKAIINHLTIKEYNRIMKDAGYNY